MDMEGTIAGHPVAGVSGTVGLQLAGAAPSLRLGGRELPLALRDALLLAWLAIEGPTPRGRLASLLWPDSDPAAARNTLRQRLFQLRRLTGVALVEGQSVLALAEGVVHDLAEADAVLGAGDAGASAELAQWLEHQRALRRQRMRLALAQWAELAEAERDWAGALSHAEELLALEPTSEAAHRRVIRLHYLAGDRAAALRAFDRCEQWLKDELGTRPGAETLHLLATLEAAQAAPPAPVPGRLPASVLRPPRLVGRERALQALYQGRQAQRVPWLVGEAGLGKSRLLQAAAQAAPGLVLAAARPGDAAVPLASLARVLTALHGSDPGAVERLARPERAELAKLLPALWPASAAAPRPSPGDAGAALLRALAAWWRAQSGGFAGLAVDDLQWADEASLEVLGDWLAATSADAAAGWLLASRPTTPGAALDRLLARLTAEARLHPVALAPLDEPELAALVDSLGLPGLPGDSVAAALHRQCGGNPLFTLETIRQAWAAGRIDEPGQAWLAARPPGVAAVIAERLASLPEAALALARVAAVAGPDFDVALAEAVLGRPALSLADDWAVLESAQVLRDEAFAHDLVFETVLAGVPRAIARHLHGRIAAHLEGRTDGEAAAARVAARVARHWEQAGRPLQALPWLARAADDAWRHARRREQLGFLERQADILAAHGRAQEAFEVLLATTRHHLGIALDEASGGALCDRLDALAVHEGQRLQARLLRLHLAAQRGDEAPALLTRAAELVDAARRLGDPALHAEASAEYGRALVMADRNAEAVAPLTAAAGWARDHAPAAVVSETAGSLAVALDNSGQLDAALPWHELAAAGAQRAGDLSQAVTSLSNLACNCIDRGDLRQAVVHLRSAMSHAGRHDGLAGQLGATWCLLGGCEVALGRYGDGLRTLEEARRRMEGEQPHYLPVIESHLAMAWWQLGQPARARQALAAIADQPGTVLVARVRKALLLARLARAGEGGRAAARAQLEAALGLFGEDERPDLRWPLRIERARDLPPTQALEELATARDATRALGHGGALLAALVRSAEAATPGDPARAAGWARDALALAERLEPATLYRPELWLAAARALEAAGAGDEAAGCWRAGQDWIRRRLHDDIAPAWRSAFTDRQPVNVALRAGAARA